MAIDWTNPVLKYGGIAAALIAIGTVGSWAYSTTEPMVVSGPLPAASEQEVAQALSTVQKGQALINMRLEAQERHNRDQDLKFNAMRRKAVLIDILEIQTELRKNPNSVSLKTAMDQDNQDLQDLALEHQTLLRGK